MDKAKIGDNIVLAGQRVDVVASDKTGVPMVNVDLDKLAKGDLATLKAKGVSVSDSSKEGNVPVSEEFADHATVEKPTLGHRIAAWFEGAGESDGDSDDSDDDDSDDDDSDDSSSDSDDDDSSFFHSSTGSFLGGSESVGGFGGGFGGFGGGGFSGGGASASF
jgi:hypothetical protein